MQVAPAGVDITSFRAKTTSGRIAFWLSVGMLLAFSQGWVSLLLGPNGDPESSGLIRAVYIPWYCVAAGLLLARPAQSLATAGRVGLLWAMLAVAAASVVWSIDPAVTERRVVAVLFTTLAGVALAARYDWPELAHTLGSAYAALAVASFLLGALVPSYGRMVEVFPGAWRGVYFDKNGLGDGMAIGFSVFLAAGALNPRRRKVWAAFAALSLLLVLLSQSKTSLVSLSIGASAFAVVVVARRGPAQAVAVTLASAAVLIGAAWLILFQGDWALSLLGKDATLTGRTKIWAAVLRQVQTRPWTGFGYGAVWTDTSGWGPIDWIVKQAGFRPHHAHNGWLEVWLGLGYVGLATWATLFVQTLSRAFWAVYRNPGAYLALPVLVIYALVSLTESVTFVYNDYVWVMFTALSVRLAQPATGWDDRLASAKP